MKLDNEHQRAALLECIQATVPKAALAADSASLQRFTRLVALRMEVEAAEILPAPDASGPKA